MSPVIDVLDERILILAPSGKDAALAARTFQREGVCCCICDDLIALGREMPRGAGALLLAEEGLFPRELPVLVEALRHQPPWSDVPVLVLTRGREHHEHLRLVQAFSPAGNLTLLGRPLSSLALITSAQAALRTRKRQYQVRDLMEEQKRASEALTKSQQEVLRLNAELEQRVAARTAELRAANSELEAFCYSVSHDLRAPLRAIDGFALSAIEHGKESLDETARSYLDRARFAVRRMQQLIDDLLGLSRLSRAQMNPAQVDLTALAQSIARDLEQTDRNRQNVEFIIQPHMTARGDSALLRIALENLLGNAWKFTSKKPHALIEFFRERDESFCVRDNGAGFEMEYAGKMFTPFQRLHTGHDFPGTGVGLAIVQRIIRRHGGDVWAEGKRGIGAAIYFRLAAHGNGVSNGAAEDVAKSAQANEVLAAVPRTSAAVFSAMINHSQGERTPTPGVLRTTPP